jgi:cellulose synthase/poly-beta-1,6-N-acetylglucosamine synthase-like glycosyltransferase
LTLGLAVVLALFFLARSPQPVLISWIVIITAIYLGTSAYKIWLLARGEQASAHFNEPDPPSDADLPMYTVLVPLHREGRILPVLIDRLELLDYPTDRLQILLLIERDDEETRRAIRQYPLPRHIRSMTMPPGQPRTKPRALNIGLHFADGEYIVIYDAEDQPERDQLRKAVAAFRALPSDVICLQARLNFYNRHQSLLTRLFAIDYAIWYDQLLPGLTVSRPSRSGVFVPLGGTSNHFRVEGLRDLGGWDPYNVTEDCDLGARLGRAGLRVGMIDSITWEEAVPRVKPWIRQRSRWVKGYLQTYLVHMRRPRVLWKQLGLRGFVDFQVLVGGSSLILLLNPIMWGLTATYVATRGTPISGFIESLFPAEMYYLALLSLVVGNFILFYSYTYVCVRRDYLELTRVAPLAPLYWIIMSIGAWVGLLSLIRDPFYWDKTEHGVSLPEPATASTVTGRQRARA